MDLGVSRVEGRGASDAVSLIRDSAGYHPKQGARTLLNIMAPKNSHPEHQVIFNVYANVYVLYSIEM